jgi:uncharacterized protein
MPTSLTPHAGAAGSSYERRRVVQYDEVPAFGSDVLVLFSTEVVRALSDAREEIDALNVFPVPDADTGTNLCLTFEAAHADLLALAGAGPELSMPELTAAYSRALLLAGRGNSGVIMAQLVGAMCRRVAEAPPGEPTVRSLAAGMAAATRASYAAVGDPVEGTILSVAKAASTAAEAAASRPDASIVRVLLAATTAARDALDRTPDQLPSLRRAGVVDAGGRGLCVVLEATEAALTGRRRTGPATTRRPMPQPEVMLGDDLTAGGPAYEVMYLLDAPDDQIPDLRARLRPLGDSLVVVGGEGLWNVHIHVDDVGAAVEAGIDTGRPHRVRVTHFVEQAAARRPLVRRGRRVVAVAYGPGLAQVFAEAGASVIEATPLRRPGAEAIHAALLETGAAEIVVLPNDRHTVAAAQAAARRTAEDGDIRVAVIPTAAQVQGLAALAVHEPGRTFDTDLVEMTAAARHARSGAVTVAEQRAITMAGPCEPGDVLGVVEGDFAIVGGDLFTVAVDVLERLVGGGGEMVTVVSGADAGDLGERCASYLGERHPTMDVVAYDGGQERYPLLFGVE